jgi:phage gp46-like protein
LAWDLQISKLNDLLFGPSRDWQTVTGEALLQQRIMLRLKMQRGSWILDDTKDLGSNLYLALRMGQDSGLGELEALVAEALEPISDEISIAEIQVEPNEHDVNAVDLLVRYQKIIPSAGSGVAEAEPGIIRFTIPETV